MSTKVEICNLALNNIGVRSITSVSELSEAARRCAIVWQPAIDAVLSEHDWNFATKIEALALISGETIPGWDYVYAYPANCLNPLKVLEAEFDKDSPINDFEIIVAPLTHVKAIATNVETAYLRYVSTVSDETLYSPAFVEAVTYKLAGMLAQPLTKNTQLAISMMNIYNSLIAKAKAQNKNEGTAQPEPTSSYIDARG